MEAGTTPGGFTAPPGFGVHVGQEAGAPPVPADASVPHVQIGRHSCAVYPQSIPYLERKLGRRLLAYVQQMEEQQDDINAESLFRFLGDGLFEATCALIPTVGQHVPEHEWYGFESREQLEEDRRLRDAGGDGLDIGPGNPGYRWDQIVTAFELAIKVNRFDVLGVLGKIVDPTAVKETLTRRVRFELATRGRERQSNLQPQSGSEPKPSGTDPTSTGNEGSPSPVSSGSEPAGPSDGSPS